MKKLPILILVMAAAAILIGACSRKVYVPVERISRDTIYRTRDHADTMLALDSIYEAVRGDTVIREVYRYRVKSRTRVDTIYRTRLDTVPVVIAPSVGETARVPRWKQALQTFVRGLRIIFIIYVLVKLFSLVRAFRQA